MRTRQFFIWTFVLLALLTAQTAGAVMVRLPVATLADRASSVIHGYVTGTQCLRRSGDIETHVTVLVEERIKGETGQTVEIVVPGGNIGGDFMFITDHPDFLTGQEVIVFLDETATRIVGQIQGKMTIQAGLVKEVNLDSETYLAALRDIVEGLTPAVDLDSGFHPISSIEGYIQRKATAYGYDGFHWDTHSVDVVINENCNCTGEGDAVQAGLYTWSHAGAQFAFVDNGSTSTTQVNQNFQNEIFWGYDSSQPDAIAYTAIWGYDNNYIAECDLLFQNSYSWSAQGDPGYNDMDVQNISTHELGHFLSLGDLYSPSDADKTMYGYAGPGETYKRTLTQDDRDGIIHIYGSGGPTDDDATDDDVTDDDTDDDWHDDDADDSTGDDSSSSGCGDLLNLIYNDCNLSLLSSGVAIEAQAAYNMCDAGGSVWDCIEACSNNDNVDSCSSFADCLRINCDVQTSHTSGSSSGDDDSGGSSCGF